MSNKYVISAAGGNPTAFKIVDKSLTRDESVANGKNLMNEFSSYGIEQTASVVISEEGLSHCEMSGGEFCGNAARAMSVLLHHYNGDTSDDVISFTMSGIETIVHASVKKVDNNLYDALCEFKDLPITTTNTTVLVDKNVDIIDLGGIVHVVYEGKLPTDYKSLHTQITQELKLDDREAVGVIWMEQNDKQVSISPIVWVKDIDTMFFEGSCGSGSIATAVSLGLERVRITQPTGKFISVTIKPQQVKLASEMEILCHE